MRIFRKANPTGTRSRFVAFTVLAPAVIVTAGLLLDLPTARAQITQEAPATTQPTTLPTLPSTQPTSEPSRAMSSTPTISPPVTEAAVARAPTIASTWTATLSAFAGALVDETDAATLIKLTSEDAVIRQFNRTQREDIMQLRAKALGMRAISVRAYLETPATIASDVAADVKASSDASDDMRRRLTPLDDAGLKRANITASKWMSTALMTSGSDPVGVIVLWHPTSPSADAADEQSNRPIFVLVRAQFIDGQCRVCQISYGDPVPASASPGPDLAEAGD